MNFGSVAWPDAQEYDTTIDNDNYFVFDNPFDAVVVGVPLTSGNQLISTKQSNISKKRKENEADASNEEEDPKRAQRKLRNKQSAKDSRDRQKSHISSLEAAVQALSFSNATLTHQLQQAACENCGLRERLERAESLLQQHAVGGTLPGAAAAPGPVTSPVPWAMYAPGYPMPLPITLPPHLLPLYTPSQPQSQSHPDPEKGPPGHSITTFALLFTFLLAFNAPIMDTPVPGCATVNEACPSPWTFSNGGSAQRLLGNEDIPSGCGTEASACEAPQDAA